MMTYNVQNLNQEIFFFQMRLKTVMCHTINSINPNLKTRSLFKCPLLWWLNSWFLPGLIGIFLYDIIFKKKCLLMYRLFFHDNASRVFIAAYMYMYANVDSFVLYLGQKQLCISSMKSNKIIHYFWFKICVFNC